MKYLLLSLVILLSGCVSKVEYVEKPVNIYHTIPTYMLQDDINITTPPSMETFMLADPMEREVILTETIIDLYSDIKLYRLKLKHIRDYDANMTKLTKGN